MRFTSLDDWLRWQESLHPRAIDLGLDRVRTVARRLGVLEDTPAVITVAGTNGKGTVVGVMEAVLVAAGWRTGSYTSPHLLRYNERIRIAGSEVGDDAIVQAFDAVDHARGDITLTYFEFGTLAALLCFQRAGCDVWLLEVGLGGRLDATNVVDSDVAVVTSIGVDHTDWLGGDRETIGAEKAGIMRPGQPSVCGDFSPPASVVAAAARLSSPLVRIGTDYGYELQDRLWSVWTPAREFQGLPLPLVAQGSFHANAATALCALQVLPAAADVDVETVRRALGRLGIPGRMQHFGEPLPMILDVAHNPDAARSLADALARVPDHGRTHAVFGLMGRKDLDGVVAALTPTVDDWHLIDWGQDDEAYPAEDVAECVRRHGGRVAGIASLEGLLDGLMRRADRSGRVVAFGSFRVAEGVLRWQSQVREAGDGRRSGVTCPPGGAWE